jgi:hypothetical protein
MAGAHGGGQALLGGMNFGFDGHIDLSWEILAEPGRRNRRYPASASRSFFERRSVSLFSCPQAA